MIAVLGVGFSTDCPSLGLVVAGMRQDIPIGEHAHVALRICVPWAAFSLVELIAGLAAIRHFEVLLVSRRGGSDVGLGDGTELLPDLLHVVVQEPAILGCCCCWRRSCQRLDDLVWIDLNLRHAAERKGSISQCVLEQSVKFPGGERRLVQLRSAGVRRQRRIRYSCAGFQLVFGSTHRWVG